ncbi:MAG TPA: CRISPR-associated helicase Cas3' [Edaphocola sp.]|nr:CRISPR-associated helicase Cas3' [Edaphocola sp.]
MSEMYYKYWGKCDDENNYHLLIWHCLDVAAVGKVYLEQNHRLCFKIASNLNMKKDKFIDLFCFFLAIHDIGKFAESFQNLKPGILQKLHKPSNKVYTNRHDTMGCYAWDKILKQSPKIKGLSSEEKRFLNIWIRFSVGHHGKPVKAEKKCALDFSQRDKQATIDWFNECYCFFEVDKILDFENIQLKDKSVVLKNYSWLLAGLTTLCDWLGSNSKYFSFCSEELPIRDYWEKSKQNAEISINSANISPANIKNDLTMKSLFPKFYNVATPLQEYCNNVEIPNMSQCWILEDVTGAGKTEAALVLASRIASKGLADGVFIALPTMATSNAMYERMSECYRAMFDSTRDPNLVLAHGARHLSKNFRQSYLENNIKDNDMNYSDGEGAKCSQWIADSNKKALLADVGVGSLDQVLLAALPVRHQSLRWLGLSNKVLIIDEIHAYDEYMLKILNNEIKALSAIGVSIILLSATLPSKLRNGLLNSYYEGKLNGGKSEIKCESMEYPLVSHLACDFQNNFSCDEYAVDTRDSVKRSVDVEFIDNEKEVFELIKKTVAEGKCICWIRNTVVDANESFEYLKKEEFIDEDRLHLFHSRFAMGDRIKVENNVLELFGKNSNHGMRRGRVLIATQVVEQSLDLDFDVLITDLAPIDYVIQRAGRLQRHLRNEKGDRVFTLDEAKDRKKPILHIYGPIPTDDPTDDWYEECLPRANFVYQNTKVLWKTQQLLLKYKKIEMPKMARTFIEGVYDDDSSILMNSKLKSEGMDAMMKDVADRFKIDFKEGYSSKSSIQWTEEENVKTRLGDDQQTVYLVEFVDNKIVPFCMGDFPWDLSSLKTRFGIINEMVYPQEIVTAIKELRHNNKRFRDEDLIVVLEKKGDLYFAEGENKKGNEVKISYDRIIGWKYEKNPHCCGENN